MVQLTRARQQLEALSALVVDMAQEVRVALEADPQFARALGTMVDQAAKMAVVGKLAVVGELQNCPACGALMRNGRCICDGKDYSGI